jgi:hypothetical protein
MIEGVERKVTFLLGNPFFISPSNRIGKRVPANRTIVKFGHGQTRHSGNSTHLHQLSQID